MSDQNPVLIPGSACIPDRLGCATSIQAIRRTSAPDFIELPGPLLRRLR
ncbi:MAG: hypothetical protein OXH76_05605 [Boseongicola sp.]|nr:hypothetical protein [Boseongicola sp.]